MVLTQTFGVGMIKSAAFFILPLLTLFFHCSDSGATTRFTLYKAESSDDKRRVWYDIVLRLALDKSEAAYGPYQIRYVPYMSIARSLESLKNNHFENYITTSTFYTASPEDDNMAFVPFPIDLGLLSYRVCFVAKQQQHKIAQAFEKGQLQSLTYGLGKGWPDARILKANQFEVIEIDHAYKRLFRLTETMHFDLFCRGANEIADENELFAKDYNLAVAPGFALYYPMPTLFATNLNNKAAIKRILAGLMTAYEDGSLQTLFEKHNKKRLDFVGLGQRELIRLSNPLTNNATFDFEQYYYKFK